VGLAAIRLKIDVLKIELTPWKEDLKPLKDKGRPGMEVAKNAQGR
jgi:hypothetical protein